MEKAWRSKTVKIVYKFGKNLALKYYRFIMGNKYAHKLAFTLLNLSPYVKNRLKIMAINQGIFQPPGNFNLIDYTTPWLEQLEREEIEKMLSTQAKVHFNAFYSGMGVTRGLEG
jgi:lipopolysaccharide biosynthesis protein